MFSSLPKANVQFWVTITFLSANAFNLDQSKILSFGKELKHTSAYVWPGGTVNDTSFKIGFLKEIKQTISLTKK